MDNVEAMVPKSAKTATVRRHASACKAIDGAVADGISQDLTNASIAPSLAGNIMAETCQDVMPALRLASECRTCQAAALFVDIVDYTRMSETLSPVEMLSVLQWFYDAMTKVTKLYGGCVERYDGDALFVTFGTRAGDGQVATAALRCACEMNDIVIQWSSERLSAGHVPIEIGVGVDLGSVAIAELSICGGRTRALQGDAINVARKLEALTRQLETGIAMSDRVVESAVAEGLSHHLVARLNEHAPRRVGRRIAPVGFWTLSGQEP